MKSSFFFFNDTATTEIYTLSLHDALPISSDLRCRETGAMRTLFRSCRFRDSRSEEHTSELQSPCNLVCRLLLEKKKHNATQSLCLTVYRNYLHSGALMSLVSTLEPEST